MSVAYDQTVGGIARAIHDTRVLMRQIDAIIQEINMKVMTARFSPQALKREWQKLYGEWGAFSIDHPLAVEVDPRIPMSELKMIGASLHRYRTEALRLYARWKAEADIPGQMSAGFSDAPPQEKGMGLLGKTLLLGAGVIGGAAVLKRVLGPSQPEQPVAPNPFYSGYPVGQMGIAGPTVIQPMFQPITLPVAMPAMTPPQVAPSPRQSKMVFDVEPEGSSGSGDPDDYFTDPSGHSRSRGRERGRGYR